MLFGSALRKLQAALENRTLVYRHETLAACHVCVPSLKYAALLLALLACTSKATNCFKILEPHGNSLAGWLARVNGVAKLVQL